MCFLGKEETLKLRDKSKCIKCNRIDINTPENSLSIKSRISQGSITIFIEIKVLDFSKITIDKIVKLKQTMSKNSLKSKAGLLIKKTKY